MFPGPLGTANVAAAPLRGVLPGRTPSARPWSTGPQPRGRRALDQEELPRKRPQGGADPASRGPPLSGWCSPRPSPRLLSGSEDGTSREHPRERPGPGQAGASAVSPTRHRHPHPRTAMLRPSLGAGGDPQPEFWGAAGSGGRKARPPRHSASPVSARESRTRSREAKSLYWTKLRGMGPEQQHSR